MFSIFRGSVPTQISIFHNASSAASNKALNLLKASLSSPYPSNKPDGVPLAFNLDVCEAVPTADQLRTILDYRITQARNSKPTPSIFVSAHPAADRTDLTVEKISEMANSNAKSFNWPLVVDWDSGRASVGSDVEGVKELLESLRKKRDGEE
ncbi:thioredoxin-like protein [Mycena floridula]|nr:thioredoxin-like protein [Mycena floridula]